jgi:hypothetical protein
MELYLHIRVVVSILVGFSLTHLLRGVARIVQHPGREKVYWVHLVWVDTVINGPSRLQAVGIEYTVRAVVYLGCSLIAMKNQEPAFSCQLRSGWIAL